MSLTIKAAKVGGRRFAPMPGGAGDPGLFGFLKGAAKTVGSFFTGGPVAAVGTAIGEIRGPGRPAGPGVPRLAAPPPPSPVTRVPGIRGAMQRAVPGGATGLQVQAPSMNGQGCPKGHRPNKSDYFLKDGTFVPKGTRCVKMRRRNPMNPKALDRAIGRLDSAKRLQNKLSGFSTKKYTASGRKKEKC